MAEAALEQIDATLSCDLAGVTPIRRKLLSEKGTIIMRLTLLAIVAFLTASCSPRVYEPPSAVPTPPRSSEVQPEPLADNLDNLRREIRIARTQAEMASSRLQQAGQELVKSKELARLALLDHPDSLRVKELTESLKRVGGNLREAQRQNVLLQLSLDVVVVEAEQAKENLHKVELQIALVTSELESYRSLHELANEKLSYASKAITGLNADAAKASEKLNRSRSWTIRWMCATLFLLLMNAGYVYARLNRLLP